MTQTTSLSSGARVSVDVSGTADDETSTERAMAAAMRELESFSQRKEEPPKPHPVIIGKSPPMLALFKMLDRIKQSDATVLVLGENGTGKELVAKSIHQSSRRANKAFVATNCSAFNDNLLESELFGHRRGAFTGAVVDKPGLFEVADGGTFFMDEVGDMSPSLQVKLLRVIQEGTFMPVGGTETRKVDVRIVAATNRDLGAMVKQGSFREDLYYRLHVVVLRVPPLRERREVEVPPPGIWGSDIEVLVEHFLKRLARRDSNAKDKRDKVLTPRALERLIAHEWPGNVRELENEMERLWVLSGEDAIIDDDLLSPSIGRRRVLPKPAPSVPLVASTVSSPPVVAASSPASANGTAHVPVGGTTNGAEPFALDPGLSMPDAVERLERRMIGDELRRARGNKTKAADALGISRRNLIRKVQAYGLDEVGRRGGES
ncbi:MAG: sigma 54-interacting transcriptional regulator [Deltaproteobacteria bacterium]|nr:sigma 54-interacting transcriptional regulator [Deltaproteobacteria bacterium]